MTICVRVTPRAKQNALRHRADGTLALHVTAVAQDGKANEAVARMLARAYGVVPSRVQLVRGGRSRTKFFEII